MANHNLLYRICPSCGGDRIVDQTGNQDPNGGPTEWVEKECTRCDENGMIPFGELSSDLISMFTDMQQDIADIKEKVGEL